MKTRVSEYCEAWEDARFQKWCDSKGFDKAISQSLKDFENGDYSEWDPSRESLGEHMKRCWKA